MDMIRKRFGEPRRHDVDTSTALWLVVHPVVDRIVSQGAEAFHEAKTGFVFFLKRR